MMASRGCFTSGAGWSRNMLINLLCASSARAVPALNSQSVRYGKIPARSFITLMLCSGTLATDTIMRSLLLNFIWQKHTRSVFLYAASLVTHYFSKIINHDPHQVLIRNHNFATTQQQHVRSFSVESTSEAPADTPLKPLTFHCRALNGGFLSC